MTTDRKKIGFYRPHKRVTQDNLVLDVKTGEYISLPSMTRQEFVAQCDINNILKQFKKTGIISHISSQAQHGTYEDLPDPLDYQESLNIILQGSEAFSSLPSKIRSRFDNDPQNFLEFMSDPKNAEEIYDLGLATRPSSIAEQSSGAASEAAPSGPEAAPPATV